MTKDQAIKLEQAFPKEIGVICWKDGATWYARMIIDGKLQTVGGSETKHKEEWEAKAVYALEALIEREGWGLRIGNMEVDWNNTLELLATKRGDWVATVWANNKCIGQASGSKLEALIKAICAVKERH